MQRRSTPQVVAHTVQEIERLRDEALAVENALADEIGRVDPGWRASARNLAHYLALRNRDLRELQGDLARLGLSSLGRAEAHALASIEAVLAALRRIQCLQAAPEPELPVDFESGSALLEAHARELLGPPSGGRPVHVMVTMPAEAADDPALVRALIETGMDCARINAAHDGPAVWERIAANTRAAAQAAGRACRVLVDLPGPKLRTAHFPAGPRVRHLKPERGPRGELAAACRLLVAREGLPPAEDLPPHDARLPLAGEALEGARAGDVLRVRDLRKRRRRLEIASAGPGWWLVELDESAWLETGLALELQRAGASLGELRVGTLPPVESPLVLRRGDLLWVVPADVPARPATAAGPARVGCTLPEVFRDARAGEPILFDDGKIAGRIRAVVPDGPDGPRMEVELTAAAEAGSKLGGDKGINLPETRFGLPALTADDLEILAHAARFADLVGMSFVHEPEDVAELQRRLVALGRADAGVVLKIETARAFQNLPRLILSGMRSPPLGVMVARGDLGVELGFERLAEVQEEILWVCEAAHVPVIWATQVLESLAKRGQASRAEVTDAAMGVRAECVMLNKGPHVLDAVRFLDDVLRRMQGHQLKKTSRLRRLAVCGRTVEALAHVGPPAAAPG